MNTLSTIEVARETLLRKRDSLLKRRAGLHSDQEELMEHHETDVPDVAADVTSARLLDRLDDVERTELERVTRALERLDVGLYGRCIVCKKQIPQERLRALPEADRCASCTNSH